jgi:hypothetical protein
MDKYTKAVLTVIAVMLVIIVTRDLPVVSEAVAGERRSTMSIKRIVESCTVYVYDIDQDEGYGQIDC